GPGDSEEAKKRTSSSVTSAGLITKGFLSDTDREVLVPYLVKNYGPGSQRRTVKVEREMQVDENKVANAMYMEYYVPPDPPATKTVSSEYQQYNQGRNRYTQDPNFDPEGNVWLTDRGFPNRLVKLNPMTGEFKDYPTPDPLNGFHDIRVQRDGTIWFGEHGGI